MDKKVEKTTLVVEPNTVVRYLHAVNFDENNGVATTLQQDTDIAVVFSHEEKVSIMYLDESIVPEKIQSALEQELDWYLPEKPSVSLYAFDSNKLYKKVAALLKEKNVSVSGKKTRGGTVFYDAEKKEFVTNIEITKPDYFPFNYSIHQLNLMTMSPKDFVKQANEMLSEESCGSHDRYISMLNTALNKMKDAPVKILNFPDQNNLRFSEEGLKTILRHRLSVLFALMLILQPENADAVDFDLLIHLFKACYEKVILDQEKPLTEFKKKSLWLDTEFKQAMETKSNDVEAAIKMVKESHLKNRVADSEESPVVRHIKLHAETLGIIIFEKRELFYYHLRFAFAYIRKFPQYIDGELIQKLVGEIGQDHVDTFKLKWPQFKANYTEGKRSLVDILKHDAGDVAQIPTKYNVDDRLFKKKKTQWRKEEEIRQYKKTCRYRCVSRVGAIIPENIGDAGRFLRSSLGMLFAMYYLYIYLLKPGYDLATGFGGNSPLPK